MGGGTLPRGRLARSWRFCLRLSCKDGERKVVIFFNARTGQPESERESVMLKVATALSKLSRESRLEREKAATEPTMEQLTGLPERDTLLT
jgi:hypothetical protein